MKKIVMTCLISLSFSSLAAQNELYDSYEVTKNMPVFYNKIKENMTFPMAWGYEEDLAFNDWRAKARDVLMVCMEDLPPAPDSYNVQLLATERRDGYVAQKLLFNVSEWSRIPAYLLIPEGKGPFPAIVMLHDHGAHFTIGKEKMVRPFGVADEVLADADDWARRCYDEQYTGDYFAANGYVVLAIDALLWGERGRKEGPNYETQQALAANLLQMGTSWGSIITMDDVRSAEFLATLPQVNPEKIGSLGFSMGAHRSWMLAATTDRIAASASICWMNTTEHLMTATNNQNKGGSAYSMIIPGIRRFMDYPHVASIACPKPSLFFNGTRDKLFPVEGVKAAYAEMQKVWESQQATDRLVTKIWEEQHFFSKPMQKETLDFFNKYLR
ncbi:dienelactone hydrolase family protein [Bacteroides sp. 51]|uniref:dienelactone hydrolase family protein n=1 Tax=Bacteroides sp. 51 TaxID=2302938 RepID=UPI0013D5A949|nr:alpha/beta hydrolase family protein [Bacteroides sp. 51]NDV81251.1 hypothetical protein [Bacteroides sp. 51]